jgi:serpin B
MTRFMHCRTSCCAIATLALAALSGCSSGSTSQDADPGEPRDLPDAWVAITDVPTKDGPSFDTVPATDVTSASEVGAAMSSLQRVIDPEIPAADVATLAHDNAAFAFAAYKQLVANNTNLVFSPASISIALAMTYAGAAGTTATEMSSTLHFTLPPERLHPAFNALDQALASRGQGFLGPDGAPMRLKIANALWAQRNYVIKSAFLDTLAANYGAGVNLLDFASAPEPSRETINDWVAEQTNNKILNLLAPRTIDGLTRLVLTDAVYLNAAWSSPFSASGTSNGTFTRADSTSVSVKFMSQHSTLPAMRGSNYVAASLPYADTRLSLLLVVPDAGQLSQVESAFDADALEALAAGLGTQPVYLSLPLFKVETQTSLAKLLATLGMPSAFDGGRANLSGINDEPSLHITDVVHKAFINVGEKGTEAAASTGVIIGRDASAGDGGPPPELPVIANRPFLYFLRDQPTGAIVFMGRVLDPASP